MKTEDAWACVINQLPRHGKKMQVGKTSHLRRQSCTYLVLSLVYMLSDQVNKPLPATHLNSSKSNYHFKDPIICFKNSYYCYQKLTNIVV